MRKQTENANKVGLWRYRGKNYETLLRYRDLDDSDNDMRDCNWHKKLARAKRQDNFELKHLPTLVRKYGNYISYDGDKCKYDNGKDLITYYTKANSVNIKGKWLGGINTFVSVIESKSLVDLGDCELNKRFNKFIGKHYKCKNTYSQNYCFIPQSSGVYLFVAFNLIDNSSRIVYVGSSNNLYRRYLSHNIPSKIAVTFPNSVALFYFIELPKGYYDYEMKLIRKLKPIFNKITYGGK